MQYSIVAASLVAAVYADYGYSSAIPVYAPYTTPAAAAPLPTTTPALPVYYTSPAAVSPVASSQVPVYSVPAYVPVPVYSSSSSAAVAPVLSSAVPSAIYSTPVAVGPKYTTEIVTALTTYCPEATQITHGTKTYTVTEATTLTITDCPCTITKTAPVLPSTKPSKAPVVTPVPTAPAKVTSAAPKPACPSGAVVSQIGDGQPQAPVSGAVDCTPAPGPKFTTVPVAPVAPSYKPATKPSSTTPKPATYTGAASKVTGAGAGLAAVFGVVAYLL